MHVDPELEWCNKGIGILICYINLADKLKIFKNV